MAAREGRAAVPAERRVATVARSSACVMEHAREMQRAQEALERLGGGQASSGANGSTPEEEQFSRSAPGTEAFKQDRSNWESLRRNLDSALEGYEASVSDRLARTRRDDRFNTGGSDRVPDVYRRNLIAKYLRVARQKEAVTWRTSPSRTRSPGGRSCSSSPRSEESRGWRMRACQSSDAGAACLSRSAS